MHIKINKYISKVTTVWEEKKATVAPEAALERMWSTCTQGLVQLDSQSVLVNRLTKSSSTQPLSRQTLTLTYPAFVKGHITLPLVSFSGGKQSKTLGFGKISEEQLQHLTVVRFSSEDPSDPSTVRGFDIYPSLSSAVNLNTKSI